MRRWRSWLLYLGVWLVRAYGRERGYKVVRGRPRILKNR
jgi:hypothetical protein